MIAISPRTRLQAQLRAVSGGKATQAPSRPKPMPTHATARRPFGRRVASGFQPRCGRTGDDASPPLTAPSPRSPWRDRARCPMVSGGGARRLRPGSRPSSDSTIRSAPTKSTIRPWIRRVRFEASSGWKTAGSRLRVDVPFRSAPKSSAERPTPTAVLRPSSATAIPVKPIVDAWMSLVERRNCHPRMSSAPARPANAPEIAIARK